MVVSEVLARSVAAVDSRAESTREAILDVAEHVFATSGYDGASLRIIQRRADVNSAAIFYYFGTKQCLYENVFARLAEPMVRERLKRLKACAALPGRPPLVEQIIAAHLTPSLADGILSPTQRWHLAQIRAQLLQAHHPFMRDMLEKHFTESGEAFLNAIAAALPDLDPRDLQWRYHTMIGALAFTMGGPGRLQLGRLKDQGPVYDPSDVSETLNQMVSLFSAMFRMPAVHGRAHIHQD
jgi:AcrR family transcriptional regulator